MNAIHKVSEDTKKLPIFQFNLNLPIKERYKQLLLTFKDKVKTYSFVTSILPTGYLVSKFGSYLLNKSKQNPEWYEYIEAVRDYCEISLSEAIMLSVTYDMACTTVITQDEKGRILLGRNLDFLTYFVIAHLMYEAEYYKNGKLLYKGIGLAGFRGGINAIKPGKFSASLNLRRAHGIMSNLYRVYQGYHTPNFHLMQVMEKAESYDEAFEMFSKTPLSAAVFYGIAGINTNEGAIISRDNDSVYDIKRLDVEKGIWYLVVTNTDFDKEEPESDQRRLPAIKNIQSIGQTSINEDNLYSKVMNIFPTNNLITCYTSIQSAQNEGHFNTTLYMP
jgi:acid ceramidase